MLLKEYQVYASETPSEGNIAPQIYTSTIFAQNEVIAKGKMFNLLKKKYKIKSTAGTILKMTEVPQYKDVKVRVYKVSGAYRSKTGVHNVMKEIRAVTKTKAVAKYYQDLMSRHSARTSCVTVIDAEEITDMKDVTSKDILQIMKDPKYPLFDNRVPATAADFVMVPLDRE